MSRKIWVQGRTLLSSFRWIIGKFLLKMLLQNPNTKPKSIIPAPEPSKTELKMDLTSIRLGNFRGKELRDLKIAYSLLIHNRYEYLEDCLTTMFKSNYNDLNVTFFLIDDGSTDQRVSNLLARIKDVYPSLDIRVIYAAKTLSTSGAVTNRAIRVMLENDEFDVIGFGDPDVIYHPDWLQVSIRLFSWLHKNYNKSKVGMVSSYNSKNREFHRWQSVKESPFGKYIIKKQMGWPSILVLPEFIRDVGAFHEMPNDETLFTLRIDALGFMNFSTELSYIEHIGQQSLLNNFRPLAVSQADYSDKLVKTGWGKEIFTYQNYSIQRDLKDNTIPTKSEVPIDIIIPLHVKDIKTFPKSIESVRANLCHPVSSITVVSQQSFEIQQIARSLDLSWLDERDILPNRKQYLDLVDGSFELSGWLNQQFLKLSVNKVGNEEHKLVLDADNVFLKPQAFINQEVIYQPISSNYHGKYFEAFSRIMGEEPVNHTSSICHFMIFKVSHLEKLKDRIENLHSCNWIDAVYANLDLTEPSCFSEFELYSHFVQKYFPQSYKPIIYKMLDLSPRKLDKLRKLQKKYSDIYSIGFQQWMK